MLARKYFFILLLIFPFFSFAQKEANTWYLGNHMVLDFNFQPPLFWTDGPAEYGVKATYSDPEGNLLLYSDGIDVWNSHKELIGRLHNQSQNPDRAEIIPDPGKENSFYIFYKGSRADPGHSYKSIYFAKVDLDANNGRGAIITTQELLHTDGHRDFTITYNQAANVYWLLTDRNDNITDLRTDRIYAYKINAGGVDTVPVISSPFYIGHVHDYKFSPRGDKLAFSSGYYPSIQYADFNPETGEITNMTYIDNDVGELEFSPNANVLYAVRDSSIYQFSLCSDDSSTIYLTKKLISEKGGHLGRPQLGPDGKIYIPQIGTEHYAVIHQPNRLGTACDLRLNDLSPGKQIHWQLPQFLTNIFYEPQDIPVPEANAGEDQVVCVGEGVRLGTDHDSDLTYRWSPETYLDDPTAARPVFRYPSQSIYSTRKIRYILSVSGAYCSLVDTVEVTVLPVPEQPVITGSRSVCPGVEEVVYQTEAKEGLKYEWSVSGGTVVDGEGTSAIKVNWGATNPDAKVELRVSNSYDCASSTTLPVRVNILLQTETPEGNTEVCSNDLIQVYQLIPTNGSVYNWESSGGEIIEGQGTNIATVQWSGEGLHHIWVKESSTTRDTVCFGTSQQLPVQVFRDSAAVVMQLVTVGEMRKQEVDLSWKYQDFPGKGSFIHVLRRAGGTNEWETVRELPFPRKNYSDQSVRTGEQYYEYRIQAQNPCGETTYSGIHNSILLEGYTDPETEEVSLQWNAYEGWEQGVKEYQLWRQLDEEDTYQLIHTSADNALHYRSSIGGDGFVHRFRVKAVEEGKGLYAWSNEIVLEFEHPITIPNVFTPNGDKFNEAFEIAKLDMYPDNELKVFDRWGKTIYSRKGYRGEWRGEGASDGIYYYTMRLNKLKKDYRGWLQIIRKGAGGAEE